MDGEYSVATRIRKQSPHRLAMQAPGLHGPWAPRPPPPPVAPLGRPALALAEDFRYMEIIFGTTWLPLMLPLLGCDLLATAAMWLLLMLLLMLARSKIAMLA